MSKVSVALTTYNGEKYILKQLHSLLFQRRAIDEVIIFDDASTDKTVEIIKDFIEKNHLVNWHFFRNRKTRGFAKNFNNAIKKTTGDIIFLCDQDDIWYKTKIGAMLNRFESDERIKAIYSSFTFIDENDNLLRTRTKLAHSNNNLIKFRVEPFETVKIGLETICSYNISPGCTLAFTKEVRDMYLERTQSTCVHDWELASIAAFMDGLYFFNTPLTNYRIHSDNTIGLPELVGKNSALQRASYENRLDKAQQIDNYFKAMQVYEDLLDEKGREIVNEKAQFIAKRLEALTEKKVAKIIDLYKNDNRHYSTAVTLKGRLADIFCVLKK